MDSKKVWLIILILFGVLFFVGGAHGFYEASFQSQKAGYVEKIAGKYSDKGDMSVYFAAQLGDIILRIKAKFAIFTLMGIAATVLGAVFLHEGIVSEKKNREDNQDDIDMTPDEVSWTF